MFNDLKFRASGVGNLMVGQMGLTEIQEQEIKDLKNERDTGVNVNGNKVKWTENKAKKLESLIYKKDNPQLSETAKNFVRETVISFVYKSRKEIKSKYLEKGILVEDDSITLLSEVDNELYFKNNVRKTDHFFTGECDIDFNDKIIDIKSSYDLYTFYEAEWKDLYYAQGQVYMRLWNKDKFQLSYCLVNKPYKLYSYEADRIKLKYESESQSAEYNENYVKELQTLNYNSFFDGELALRKIPKEERVKSFECNKDEAYMEELIYRVKLARKYAQEWWENRLKTELQ